MNVKRYFIILILGLLLPLFQNCNESFESKTGKTTSSSSDGSEDGEVSDGGSSGEEPPVTPPVTPPPVNVGQKGNSNAVLNFSDIISGPKSGLGDGKGSGAIVTIWGQNIGDQKGTSKLILKDSAGVKHEPYLYYWKRADGKLPGGPVDLYTSHFMQEIAFSIPDEAALGDASILIELDGSVESNSLPFLIRAGNIYHVKPGGNNSNDGSFNSAWKTISGGTNNIKKEMGALVYIHNVEEVNLTSKTTLQVRGDNQAPDEKNQMAIVSYPGQSASVTGQGAISTYTRQSLVVSKFYVFASNNKTTSATGQPSNGITNGATFAIQGSAQGRIVANKITDIPGGCASKTQGAITGGSRYADYVSNLKVFGNEIYDYGCPGSYKLHHTTYFSIRSGDDNEQLPSPELGWNYLHGNHAKNGLHFFDQGGQGAANGPNGERLTDNCGNFVTPLKIHNNVVINQAGTGISVGSSGCDTWAIDGYIYNNLIVNSGLPVDWDGVDPNSQTGTDTSGISIGANNNGLIRVYHNTVLGWSAETEGIGAEACFSGQGGGFKKAVFNHNICVSNLDKRFVGFGFKGGDQVDFSGSGNVLFCSIPNAANANIPSGFSASISTNPKVSLIGPETTIDFGNYGKRVSKTQLSFEASSPVVNQLSVSDQTPTRDLYGRLRGEKTTVGALDQ